MVKDFGDEALRENDNLAPEVKAERGGGNCRDRLHSLFAFVNLNATLSNSEVTDAFLPRRTSSM